MANKTYNMINGEYEIDIPVIYPVKIADAAKTRSIAVYGEDVREVVYSIMEANNLRNSSFVDSGNKLIVPVKVGEK